MRLEAPSTLCYRRLICNSGKETLSPFNVIAFPDKHLHSRSMRM